MNERKHGSYYRNEEKVQFDPFCGRLNARFVYIEERWMSVEIDDIYPCESIFTLVKNIFLNRSFHVRIETWNWSTTEIIEKTIFRRRREFREKFTIIRSIPHLREKLGRGGFLTEARRKIIRILSIDVVFEIVALSKQSRNVETNSDTFRRINYNLPLLSFQTSRTTLSIWKTLRMRERRNGKGLGRYTPDEGQVLARRN